MENEKIEMNIRNTHDLTKKGKKKEEREKKRVYAGYYEKKRENRGKRTKRVVILWGRKVEVNKKKIRRIISITQSSYILLKN